MKVAIQSGGEGEAEASLVEIARRGRRRGISAYDAIAAAGLIASEWTFTYRQAAPALASRVAVRATDGDG